VHEIRYVVQALPVQQVEQSFENYRCIDRRLSRHMRQSVYWGVQLNSLLHLVAISTSGGTKFTCMVPV